MQDFVQDNTEHLFYPIYHRFIDKYLAQMKGSSVKVFMAIARKVNFASGIGPITIATIEALSGCCHHTTVEAFAELEDIGILTRKMSSGQATTYTISQQINPPQKMDGVVDDPRQKMEGDSPQKLHSTPGKKCTHIEIKERIEKEILDTKSSQADEASSQQHGIIPQYGFGEFIRDFPDHRINAKAKKEASKLWYSMVLSPEEAFKIGQYLQQVSKSEGWTKEEGRYAVGPVKFLEQGRWRDFSPPKDHSVECDRVRQYFIEQTGQAESANKMTRDRLAMLSVRYEEALVMSAFKPEGSERVENAVGLMMDAVDACRETLFYVRNPDSITLESMFFTAEKFEKYVKRELKSKVEVA